MPEGVDGNQDVSHQPNAHGASVNPTPISSESQNGPTESVISPRASESDIPCPLDSQSSLDEEYGGGRKILTLSLSDGALTRGTARRRPLRTRIQETLRLEKRYSDGYESGQVNQIIRSCRQLVLYCICLLTILVSKPISCRIW